MTVIIYQERYFKLIGNLLFCLRINSLGKVFCINSLKQLTFKPPVLRINDHATGGRRTKDILGGPKGWGPKKKVANAEIYVIFEVFAFCGGRTKTDFKDRDGDSTFIVIQVRERYPGSKCDLQTDRLYVDGRMFVWNKRAEKVFVEQLIIISNL